MLAKWWKKIGLLILIVACLFNVTSKLVKRVSFNENVKGTVTNTVDNVVTQVKDSVGGSDNKKNDNTDSKKKSSNTLKDTAENE